MKRVVLFVLFLIGRISLSAQVFDQSVINTLQRCIQQKQYERADFIINSFRNTDLPEISVFWLNLTVTGGQVPRHANEESIIRQFKEVKRKSRLYISADDLDRLRIENPHADCGIMPGTGRMPVDPTAPCPAPPFMVPIIPQTQETESTDDLPF